MEYEPSLEDFDISTGSCLDTSPKLKSTELPLYRVLQDNLTSRIATKKLLKSDLYYLHVTTNYQFWIDQLLRDWFDESLPISVIEIKTPGILIEDPFFCHNCEIKTNSDSSVLIVDKPFLMENCDFKVELIKKT